MYPEIHGKSTLSNGRFMNISTQVFAIYRHIFHKTEIRTVILRCLKGLNLDLFKSYDTKRKFFCFQLFSIMLSLFLHFLNFQLFFFCIGGMTFKPKKIWTHSATQNDCLNLSFVKDMIVVGKQNA